MADPVSEVVKTYFTSTYSYVRVSNRQQRPYNKVLPFEYNVATGQEPSNTHIDATYAYTTVDLVDWTDAINTCYAAFKDACYTNAQLGITIATAEQAVSMISARATQLARAARYLRRGNFTQFCQTLKVPQPRNPKPHKAFADNWLEYSYGWAPLVGDMQNAVRALSEPVRSNWIKVRAANHVPSAIQMGDGDHVYHEPSNRYPYAYLVKQVWHHEVKKCGIQMGAELGIDNPNLHLAEQLGVLNPAVIVWDLIPYSFLVDQVANVGQFLALGTDFLGLKLTNAYTTRRLVTSFKYSYEGYLRHEVTDGDPPLTHFVEDPPDIRSFGAAVSCTRRTLGLETPRLTFSAPITGWKRALNDVSLLLKLL